MLAGSILAACGGSPATPPAPPVATLLASASAELARVSSFHITGMLDPGVSIDLVVSGANVRGSVTTHGVTWEEVGIAGEVYVRGRALWDATLPTRAAELGEQWVAVHDPSAGFNLAFSIGDIRRGLTVMVFGAHPGLALTGTVTVGGQRATELSDASDIYDIAQGPTPYPLRWLDREDPAAGGRPCGVTLSDFGAAVTITAPVATATVTAPPSPS